MFDGKAIIITGGTGSWGRELTKQLLGYKPKEIRIFSRNEFNQVSMEREFNNPLLTFIIGDVRDACAVANAFRGVEYIFHAAAIKHVPICERQPLESIQTNVLGTQNVVNACLELKHTIMVDISSDKAVAPNNMYGLTKAIGEHITLLGNNLAPGYFRVIRGGNAIGSAGSVIPFFIEQIKTHNKVTITDENMTRYFITLKEACTMVLEAARLNSMGGTLVMKMPSCKIVDLAEVLIQEYGKKDTRTIYTGRRKGEKLHEVLVSSNEVADTYIYNEKYYLISPTVLNLPKVTFTEYTSNSELMDKDQIKTMLVKSGLC